MPHAGVGVDDKAKGHVRAIGALRGLVRYADCGLLLRGSCAHWQAYARTAGVASLTVFVNRRFRPHPSRVAQGSGEAAQCGSGGHHTKS
jgi:hypothetical protein